MKTKEIISILINNGLHVSGKQLFYDGCKYGQKYGILEFPEIDGRTDYMNYPTKVYSVGFVWYSKNLYNFYFYEDGGYNTYTDINYFINKLQNNIHEI